MKENLKILRFIYPPFLTNNNVRHQIIHFIDNFDPNLIEIFLNLQEDKIGLNEQISLKNENNGNNFSIEYDCLNNLLDMCIQYNDGRERRLTSFLQLEQVYTKETIINFPSQIKYAKQKLKHNRLAYINLTSDGEFLNTHKFLNQDGDLVADINECYCQKSLICSVNKNNEIYKTKQVSYNGLIDILNKNEKSKATITIEEVFKNADMFALDFDNERYVCRNIYLEKYDDLCYEETTTYNSIDHGLYQIIKKDALGESAYFGDIVGNQSYYVREYDPHDKGLYNFNNKKSKGLKISKRQLDKIINDEIQVSKLFEKIKE